MSVLLEEANGVQLKGREVYCVSQSTSKADSAAKSNCFRVINWGWCVACNWRFVFFSSPFPTHFTLIYSLTHLLFPCSDFHSLSRILTRILLLVLNYSPSLPCSLMDLFIFSFLFHCFLFSLFRFTHSLTHSFPHSLTCSYTHSLINLLACSVSLRHSLT